MSLRHILVRKHQGQVWRTRLVSGGHCLCHSNSQVWAVKADYCDAMTISSRSVMMTFGSTRFSSSSSSDKGKQDLKEKEKVENVTRLNENNNHEENDEMNSCQKEEKDGNDSFKKQKVTPLDNNNNSGGNVTLKKEYESFAFPWRSSSESLPRVLECDDLSGLPNNSRSRFVRKALAARELDKPWYQILLTKSWETELAAQFAWAFPKALAALLAHSNQVPLDAIEDDDSGYMIHFDSSKHWDTNQKNIQKHETKLSSIECKEEESNINNNNNNDNNNENDDDGTTEDSTAEDRNKDLEEYLSSMIDDDLLKVYNDNYKLLDCGAFKLDMKVIDYKLESAFVVPMFTRQDVKKNPKLKGAYQAIEQEFTTSANVQLVREMGEQLAKETDFSGNRVIIADVSIQCMESLQIFNKDDELIQGTKDAQPVTHLVRFEMVTNKEQDEMNDITTSGRIITNWKIIDWDDMLDGNVWH